LLVKRRAPSDAKPVLGSKRDGAALALYAPLHRGDDGDGELETFGGVRGHDLNLIALIFIGKLGLGIERFLKALEFIEEIDEWTVRGARARQPEERFDVVALRTRWGPDDSAIGERARDQQIDGNRGGFETPATQVGGEDAQLFGIVRRELR